MNLRKINDIEKILLNTFWEEGLYLDDVFTDIHNRNSSFSYQEKLESLQEIVFFLVSNQIVELRDIDDKPGNNSVALEQLDKFIKNTSEKVLTEEPLHFYKFEYPKIVWVVPFPMDFSKYEY